MKQHVSYSRVLLFLCSLPVLLCASCTAPPPPPPPPLTQAKSELQAVYDAQDAGISHKDASVLQANLASDFSEVTGNGETVNAYSFIIAAKNQFERGDHFNAKSDISDVVIDGGKVRATVHSKITYDKPTLALNVHGDMLTGPGATNFFEIATISIDTWTKENVGWKCHESKVFSTVSTENGRPM